MKDNPYAPPIAAQPDLPAAASGDPAEAALRAFVGPRSERYLRQWSALRHDKKPLAGLNVAAFFFGPFWFAYRKLYVELALIIGGLVVLGGGQAILEESLGQSLPSALDNALNIATGVTLSLLANPLYYRRAQRVIGSVHAASEEERLREIAERGGTSWLSVLVLAGAVGLLIYLFVMYA